MTNPSYQNMLQKIIDDWIASAPQNETDNELGHALMALIQILVQLRYTPCPTPDEQERLFTLIVNRLSAARFGPKYSIPEAILRRLSEDPGDAVRYLFRHLATQSEQQSRRAQSPRPNRKNSITRLIEEILEGNIKMSAKMVGLELEASPEITLLDDEYRHEFDASTLKVSNLASRVSEARKRVSG